MNKILAYYDVRGIQDFLFASNKLKENVGASLLVCKVLGNFLDEAIQETCQEGRYIIDWQGQNLEGIQMKEKDLDAEIIYSGGGNAMVAYKDNSIYQKVNRALSRKILIETGGAIRFTSAYTISDFSDSKFQEDRLAVVKEMEKRKYGTVQTSPLMGIAVTCEGKTDGLPAQMMETFKENRGREFLSIPAKKKRDQEGKEYSQQEVKKITGDYALPLEFDDLGRKKGESHIAVVHIDGNNMGQKIKKLHSYGEMKKFSIEITKIFEKTRLSVIKYLQDELNKGELLKKLNLKVNEDDKLFLPLRFIVSNGDDVTFVTDGRLGVPLAEAFLKKLSDSAILLGDRKISLSACAGVAIVKSHFPFFRAYQLADDLCKSAKLKGKILVRQKNGQKIEQKNYDKEMGSWLDFHIVYSGITTNLEQLRKRQYNIPGFPEAEPLKYPPRSVSPEMEQKRYNLLQRPWCAAGDCDETYRWDHLKKILGEFKDENEWPRSRLKRLRNESIKSKKAINTLLAEYNSRDLTLPDFLGKKDYLDDNNCSPYFDALELLDFYELPIMEENK